MTGQRRIPPAQRTATYGTGTPEDPWVVRPAWTGYGSEPRASCLRCHKNVGVMRNGTLRPHADPTLGPNPSGYGTTAAARCGPTDHLIRGDN